MSVRKVYVISFRSASVVIYSTLVVMIWNDKAFYHGVCQYSMVSVTVSGDFGAKTTLAGLAPFIRGLFCKLQFWKKPFKHLTAFKIKCLSLLRLFEAVISKAVIHTM